MLYCILGYIALSIIIILAIFTIIPYVLYLFLCLSLYYVKYVSTFWYDRNACNI